MVAILLNCESVVYNEAISFLNPSELTVLTRLTHVQRRVEWVTSRVLLKFAYLNYLQSQSQFSWYWVCWEEITNIMSVDELQKIEIIKSDSTLTGPPIVVDLRTGHKYHEVSISHKWPFIAVVSYIDTSHAGIDIERIGTFSSEFREFYFQVEVDNLYQQFHLEKNDINEHRLLTLLWILKESFIKTNVCIAHDVHEVRIVLRMVPDIIRSKPALNIQTEMLEVEIHWRGARFCGVADLYMLSDGYIASLLTIK